MSASNVKMSFLEKKKSAKKFVVLCHTFVVCWFKEDTRHKALAQRIVRMNEESFKIISTLIDSKYAEQCHQAIHKRQRRFQTLLSQRCMPEEGWDDLSICIFLDQLSQMDCNNQLETIGVGEREGRVFSKLVSERNYYLSHGIGRSGDLTENQPKAAGSSLILSLCNLMVCHALKLAGAQETKKCIVVPMCTGMALSLILRALYLDMVKEDKLANNLSNTSRKYVIWLRIDQKSCLKCIQTAGFEAIVIENVYTKEDEQNADALSTNIQAIEAQIEKIGKENILCVLSTTSCFAPRVPDKVVLISKLCKKYNIGHIVNNAYGVQCRKTMSQISAAMVQGRLDAFVQSTDKNFMVPVGGAIIASNDTKFIDNIAATYAGRASISPILDLFITLLSMGSKKWTSLLQERSNLVPYFKEQLSLVASRYGERLLSVNNNSISIAMSVDKLEKPSQIGAQLFYRGVSGIRVVTKGSQKEVAGIKFSGYGSHTDNYPCHYLTVACAIGIKKEDIDRFIQVFDKMLKRHYGNKRE